MSTKIVTNLIVSGIIACCSSLALGQDRPTPEPAQTIDLPEVVESEPAPSEVVEVAVAELDDSTTEEERGPTATPETVDEVEVVTGVNPNSVLRWPTNREVAPGLVVLAFDEVSIDETLGFIAQTTGKVVIPVSSSALRAKKITLRNDTPVNRTVALDLLFQAFRLNQIGVIERDDIIIIGPLDAMLSDIGDIPVLGVTDDVMNRQDRGTLVIKVYAIERAEADVIGNQITEMFPDYGSLGIYPESNQLVLLGDIGLCQQIQELINQLDKIWRSGTLNTFRLKHADASEISTNILDLFEESTTSGARSQPNNNRGRTGTTSSAGDEVELRLTVNVQQNSVTVQAEPDVMEEIDSLINGEWDLPRPAETSKMYVLEYSDPIKIRNLLQEILGDGTTSNTGGARTGQQNQRAAVTQAVSGVYRFEAYPDKNALLVLSKTQESFAFLDSIIESLDQPSDVGLPKIVELKHANAVALAEELNALLAAPGVSATIQRPDVGLSAEGFEESATGADNESGGQMAFPWQQGGANSDDQSPESSLIAKIRLVPIVRQNALAVLAPPAYLDAVLDVIEEFDRATRQVMISATIAAVTLTDELKLGLRWGSNVSSSGDNSVGLNGDLTGNIDNILGGIFDGGASFALGTTLNNVGIALDALNQLTNVRIIQQPRTFTADNQESVFFNGSEVPVQTEQSQSSGVVTGGFEYRDVGVLLNIRPRITSHGDIDLTINVELSDVQAGSSGVGNNPIFTRRQVRSQVQLHDGETVLIGGLLKESESKVKQKFPLLGDLPIIGSLFTSVDDNTIREELLVFITPVIVDSNDNNNLNYNQDYLERLQEISLPIEDQVESIQDQTQDFLVDRLRNPGADYKPRVDSVQSTINGE